MAGWAQLIEMIEAQGETIESATISVADAQWIADTLDGDGDGDDGEARLVAALNAAADQAEAEGEARLVVIRIEADAA